MVEPYRAIQGLPLFKFKGLTAPPYDDASFSFEHRQSKKSYPYLDGAAHESVGLDVFPLQVKMYFLNTLQKDAFPDLWLEWWEVLRDGTPGPLEHPLIGSVDAVVLGGDVQLIATVTAGIVATVRFNNTILDPENVKDIGGVSISLEDAATQADQAANAVEITPPSQASVTTLEQLAGVVRGLLEYGSLASDYINKAQSWVDEMIQLSKESQDHIQYDAQEKLVLFYNALSDLNDSLVSIQRDTGAILTNRKTTLDVFARERGNTLQDIMTLNPGALTSPIILPGTMLKYYV